MAKEKKEEKSPLLNKKDEQVKRPDYTPDEELYLSSLKERMENAFEPPESFESENWLDLPYDSF